MREFAKQHVRLVVNGKCYIVIHKNIQSLHLILCISIAILGGNKIQIAQMNIFDSDINEYI